VEGLNFQNQSSLAKHSGAGDVVWYQVCWTRKGGTERPTMSQPTKPKDPGKETHDRAGLKIIIR
jgi:hypothetical protein